MPNPAIIRAQVAEYTASRLATGGPFSCALCQGAFNRRPDLPGALLNMGVFGDGREAAPIWLYDHECEATNQIWIGAICRLEPGRKAEGR